ncbi:hypothetical protein [Legionella oakridgensis]|uniref:Dot/Icm T4SS effector n=2 Tax=Legionella oakridgensis TaxID=29423 RepID=W0B8W6_9GAMM|nr:hypothetical protein [Legionella oakridgensis]AHE66983.1 hypothetical protein Loa_01430 [Legionella oakridgensis ATCC 33761 = DSM 21215]KTD38361.1 Dot/Icm T4SS effector [Legionella oakridgensis]STY20085.1 Dot/Icm secretion system substrate [Legionella longbeachae]
MAVRVLSFDFDGCLFNEAYCEAASDDKNIIAHNRAFLEKIKAENQLFSHVTAFIGSNRQSLEIDEFCTTDFKGSCFPEIKHICDYLGVDFDPLLLADICGKLPDGMSYARAIDKDYTGEHSAWVFDASKLIILYAQIHKMANQYSDESIVFDFYDDKGKGCRAEGDDLLEYLQQFFNTYPELLPANVTLRLNHYAGSDVSPYTPIQGTGRIDPAYRQTILDMIQISEEEAFRKYPDIDMEDKISATDFVTPELLRLKAQQRALIARPLELIEERIERLRRQLEIAQKLHEELSASSAGYYPTVGELRMQLVPNILAARDQLSTNDSLWTEKMSEHARHVLEFAHSETMPSIRSAAASGLLVFASPVKTAGAPDQPSEKIMAAGAAFVPQ